MELREERVVGGFKAEGDLARRGCEVIIPQEHIMASWEQGRQQCALSTNLQSP